ncbi:MAG: NAD(P)/FAD-dependent oxidoreductase [Limnochordia bacterium]|jgi:predicted Rossmann fold flavoprotein|nr:NAD(P)/FAD-dependent oxidoreductase [Limnochordia bacterium]
MSTKVIVIGAGASGLLAAGFLAQRGAEVHVLEKMQRSAAKVRISGKGRCNITNAMPIAEYPPNYPGNGRFLYSSLHRFSNLDCIAFFEKLGVETKTERGQRVFPISDDAHEVANALERFALSSGAKIHFGHKALEIRCDDAGSLLGVVSSCDGREGFFQAKHVVVATGGLSYPGTGSTGDGLVMAKSLGHGIIPPRPALVPLRVEEAWVKELTGLSLRNVELTVVDPAGGQQSFFGELMFAHFGLTGPIVLTASEQVGRWLEKSGMPVKAFLDVKPALSQEQLDNRLLRDFELYSRKQFRNTLDELLPKSLIPIIVNLAGISADKVCHQITREERTTLRKLLKAVPLTISKTLPMATAIVTAGGIDVREIDPRTMESKKVKGVFFCGEVIDIHGITGGFNLQAAFSTGYCAAQGIEL